MKTLGRILIILIAFTIMMGITYKAVSASGSSTNTPAFREGSEGFASSNGERHESRDEGGGSIFGMIFGMLKNTMIVAVIVALIVFPKKLLQQRRRAVSVQTN